jgi:hypothetical protein
VQDIKETNDKCRQHSQQRDPATPLQPALINYARNMLMAYLENRFENWEQ